jgi:hypothetical protein
MDGRRQWISSIIHCMKEHGYAIWSVGKRFYFSDSGKVRVLIWKKKKRKYGNPSPSFVPVRHGGFRTVCVRPKRNSVEFAALNNLEFVCAFG